MPEITRGCGRQHTGSCPAERAAEPEPIPTLSDIILRLERIDQRRRIPGVDPYIVAGHLTECANQLYRLAMNVRKGRV